MCIFTQFCTKADHHVRISKLGFFMKISSFFVQSNTTMNDNLILQETESSASKNSAAAESLIFKIYLRLIWVYHK